MASRRAASLRAALQRRMSRKAATCALLAAALLAPAAAAQESAATAADSGVFQILAARNRVGTESFRMRHGAGGWEVTGELQLQAPNGGRVSETSTLRLNSSLHPVSYERVQKSPNTGHLVAQIGATETTLEMTTDNSEEPFQQIFYLPRNDLVILDTNFFHHYAVLVRLYDRARGGAQPFNVFIPQEALPGTIHLQLLGREPAPAGSSSEELDHFQAVTDELQIEIWATPEGALQRLSIPKASLEVVRQ